MTRSHEPSTSTAAQQTASRATVPLSGFAIGLGWFAAAITNALAIGPLLSVWLHFTGQKYLEGLLIDSGLTWANLGIPDRTLIFLGLEIVLRSASWWVLLGVLGLTAGLSLGLAIIPIAGLLSWLWKRLRPSPSGSPSSTARQRRMRTQRRRRRLRFVAAYGLVAWVAFAVLFVLMTAYAVTFETPDRALCVGEAQYQRIRNPVKAGCAGCGTFGEKKLTGVPILFGKEQTIFFSKAGALYVDTKSLSPANTPNNPLKLISIKEAVSICSYKKL